MFFEEYYKYYYIVLILQAVCAIHCIRKGNQNKWIWLIIFIPLIGSLAYIFTEIFTKTEMEKVQSGVGAVFNPSGKVKSLEENLRFADTFVNRIALADAYLDARQTEKAIQLYETSLTGTFVNNEHANRQLIIAYFEAKRYEEVVTVAKKIYHVPQFARSRAHMLYAIALSYTGNNEMADQEFQLMRGRFSNYECRYHYGRFLTRNQRIEEAKDVFKEILNEASHLNSYEKRDNREWFAKTKDALKGMNVH